MAVAVTDKRRVVHTVAREGAYGRSTPEQVRATLRLLRHYRAFLASPCTEMRSPEQWGVYYNKADVERRLAMFLHVAINRKAGIPDLPAFNPRWENTHYSPVPRVPRKYGEDWQTECRRTARALNGKCAIHWLPKEWHGRFAHRLADPEDYR